MDNPKEDIQPIHRVILDIPHYSHELESSLQKALPQYIDDPLYSENFDPITYINQRFPTTDSLTNDAVTGFLSDINCHINSISAELKTDIRKQSSIHHDTHKILESTNTEINELFNQIKMIRTTAGPSETLAAKICDDISALDKAKQHLQDTASGLRNLHMLSFTTSRFARRVMKGKFSKCWDSIQDVDYLIKLFKPYYHLEKIHKINSQITLLKSRIGEQATALIQNTIMLNVPTHTSLSFADDAARIYDACRILSLVDTKQQTFIISALCQSWLQPYTHIFLQKEHSGIDNIDRRYAWFRQEFKRLVSIYDNLIPSDWCIWTHVYTEFCQLTRKQIQDELKSNFFPLSYQDVWNSTGVGYTTYTYDHQNRLVNITQGRDSTSMPQDGSFPIHPFVVKLEEHPLAASSQPEKSPKEGRILAKLSTWADRYQNDPATKPGTTTKKAAEQDDGGVELSLDDFMDETHSSSTTSRPGLIRVPNEKQVALLVNAVAKSLAFERETTVRLKSLTEQHTARDGMQSPQTKQPSRSSTRNVGTPQSPISGIFDPYLPSLVVVERAQLLSIINQAISSEQWVPTEVTSKLRYASVDQLLYYIKRSLDNISKVCGVDLMVLVFQEYITALRHYINVLEAQSKIPLASASASLSSLTALSLSSSSRKQSSHAPSSSASSSSPSTAPALSISPLVPSTTTCNAVDIAPVPTASGGASKAPLTSPYTQHPYVLAPVPIGFFRMLCVCFNTIEYISDVLPQFLSKLADKLADDTPLPQTNPDEMEITEYAQHTLQNILQNLCLSASFGVYNELKIMTTIKWDKFEDVGDCSPYARETVKAIQSYSGLAHVFLSPKYHSYLANRLSKSVFSDCISALLQCHNISPPASHQIGIDLHIITSAVNNLYTWSVDVNGDTVTISAQNTPSLRTFHRLVKKDIARIESLTKVIAGGADNIIDRVIIILFFDVDEHLFTSLLSVVGVPLTQHKKMLHEYQQRVQSLQEKATRVVAETKMKPKPE